MANRKIFAVSLTSEFYVNSHEPGWNAFIHRYNPSEGLDSRTCRYHDCPAPRNVVRLRALQDALQKHKESK